jgi:hypothetical protein
MLHGIKLDNVLENIPTWRKYPLDIRGLIIKNEMPTST